MPPLSIAGSHDAQVASDLLIGNPLGHRSTPLSAGRLRMPSAVCFHGASGTCSWQGRFVNLPLAIAKAECHTQEPTACSDELFLLGISDTYEAAQLTKRKEATSSAGSPWLHRQSNGWS